MKQYVITLAEEDMQVALHGLQEMIKAAEDIGAEGHAAKLRAILKRIEEAREEG